jgi:hypothetical protein
MLAGLHVLWKKFFDLPTAREFKVRTLYNYTVAIVGFGGKMGSWNEKNFIKIAYVAGR